MKEFEKYIICDGVEVVQVPATRFKTNETAISFAVPLSAENASVNSLLVHILAGCSADYPDLLSLNRKLAMLYGASLNCSVSKHGKEQILTLYLSSLDDRFSIDGELISEESLKLLLSLIFSPKLDGDGFFFDEDIEREKRVVCEKLESEISAKRVYALRRLEEEMFCNEAYGVNALGSIEKIKSVSKQELRCALKKLMREAKISIISVGNADADSIVKTVMQAFDGVQREYKAFEPSASVRVADKVKTVEERQTIKQGKLVLGFRVDMEREDEKSDVMRIFTDVFGGGPYSKLFMNVREKLSLCYYCSANFNKRNCCIIVQCGCEEENMNKAVEEMLSQIESIKNGDFKEEFEASIIGLCDSISSVYDDSAMLLSWYVSQVSDKTVYSPNEYIAKFKKVTFDEIQRAASLLSLDTVFKLMSVKEDM